jgi:ABC-type multidrug transport system fused ATPase/permease subunit
LQKVAFLYPTSRTIKTMVEEKETRMKETLYILGVRPWAHWFSWLVTSVVVFAIISVLVTLTLTSDVLANSNPAYIFAFIGLFSAATIGFCFAIAACFSKAKLAAIVGPVALFATLLPRFIFFGSNRYEAIPAKIWASLLPCTAFAFGADIVADYEYAGVGVQSWNAGEGKYSFNTSLTMLFLDTILYSFLGWYLELTIPRQYGLARPWYFLCEPSYWTGVVRCCFQSGKPRKYSVSTEPGGSSNFADNAEAEQSDDFEAVRDPSWVPRVVIRNLTKKYGRKKDVHTAVDNLNLALYESQVTCLLGHNGAG